MQPDSQQVPVGILSLPDETLLQILSCFEKYDNYSLYSLVLACRRLSLLVTPYLYDTVRLTRRNVPLLARTFESKSEYSQRVKGIHILWEISSDVALGRFDAPAALSQIFTPCTELEELVCADREWGTFPDPENLLNLSNLMNLKTIEAPADVSVLRLFPICSYVQKLILDEEGTIVHTTDVANDETLRHNFPSLKHLELRRRHSSDVDRHSVYWLIWAAFPNLNNFCVDRLGCEEAESLLFTLQGRLTHLYVEIDSGTHLRNFKAVLAIPNDGKDSATTPPPSLELVLDWPVLRAPATNEFLHQNYLDFMRLQTSSLNIITYSRTSDIKLKFRGRVGDVQFWKERFEEDFPASEVEKGGLEEYWAQWKTLCALSEARNHGNIIKETIEKKLGVRVQLDVTVRSDDGSPLAPALPLLPPFVSSMN